MEEDVTTITIEKDECIKILDHLQQYVPHLEKLIAQLKDPKRRNRELQLNKLECLRSMITDRKKKLKLDTLRRCEDVILRILHKVYPTIFKQLQPKSEPCSSVNMIKFVCKDPPEEHSKMSLGETNEFFNLQLLNTARACLSEVAITPASPSPPRDTPLVNAPHAPHAPIVIPTEMIPKLALNPNEFHSKKWDVETRANLSRPYIESYETEKSDCYSSVAESLTSSSSKKIIFDRLGTKVDVPIPPLSAQDLQQLTAPERMNLLDLRTKLTRENPNKMRDREHKAYSTIKPVLLSPRDEEQKVQLLIKSLPVPPPVSSFKPKSPGVQKIYKNPDSRFGNLLSSIDEQILGDNVVSPKISKKKDQTSSKNKAKAKEEKLGKSEHKREQDSNKNSMKEDHHSSDKKDKDQRADKKEKDQKVNQKGKIQKAKKGGKKKKICQNLASGMIKKVYKKLHSNTTTPAPSVDGDRLSVSGLGEVADETMPQEDNESDTEFIEPDKNYYFDPHNKTSPSLLVPVKPSAPVPTSKLASPVKAASLGKAKGPSKVFDNMTNLTLSSFTETRMASKVEKKEKSGLSKEEEAQLPVFVPTVKRYVCGASYCNYLCLEESILRYHLQALHSDEPVYKCTHCSEKLSSEKGVIDVDNIIKHLRLHDLHLYKCSDCKFLHNLKHKVERHVFDKHTDKPASVIIVREIEYEPEEQHQAHYEEVKEAKPWHCGMCNYRCTAKQEIIAHVYNKHHLKTQYKCAQCKFLSNEIAAFTDHFQMDHPGQNIVVINAYYDVIEIDDDVVDVTSVNSENKKVEDKEKYSFKLNIDELVIQKVEERVKSVRLEDENPVTPSMREIEKMDVSTLRNTELSGTYGSYGKPFNKQFVCPLCGVFKTEKAEDVTYHLYKELHYPRFVCTSCGLTGITYNFLQKHSAKKHIHLPEAIHPLSPDSKVEDWVQKVLLVQRRLMSDNENLVSSTTVKDEIKNKDPAANNKSCYLQSVVKEPLKSASVNSSGFNSIEEINSTSNSSSSFDADSSTSKGNLHHCHWAQKSSKCAHSCVEDASDAVITGTSTKSSKRFLSRTGTASDAKKIKLQESESAAVSKSMTVEVKDKKSEEITRDYNGVTPAPQIVILNAVSEYMQSKNLKKLSRNDLEQICLMKMCEAICHKSEIAELRHQLCVQKQMVEMCSKEATKLTKQAHDLEIANRKLRREVTLQNERDEPLIPVKIVRSVGLQVHDIPAKSPSSLSTKALLNAAAQSAAASPTTTATTAASTPSHMSTATASTPTASSTSTTPVLTSAPIANKSITNSSTKSMPEPAVNSKTFIDLTDEDDKKPATADTPTPTTLTTSTAQGFQIVSVPIEAENSVTTTGVVNPPGIMYEYNNQLHHGVPAADATKPEPQQLMVKLNSNVIDQAAN